MNAKPVCIYCMCPMNSGVIWPFQSAQFPKCTFRAPSGSTPSPWEGIKSIEQKQAVPVGGERFVFVMDAKIRPRERVGLIVDRFICCAFVFHTIYSSSIQPSP